MVHAILFSTIGLGFLTRKSGWFLKFIPFFILLLFASLRYMYGSDYPNYLRSYYYIHDIGGTVFKDSLFVWMNKIFPNFYSMIATISIFFVCVIFWMIKKNVAAEYTGLSLFVFVINPYIFLMNLSAIRQCVAMLFFIIAVHFARKKNYIAYFFLVLIATLFHKSAIILLPIVFLISEKKVGKKFLIGFFIVFLALLSTSFFSSIINGFIELFDDKNYAHYAGGSANSIRATLLSSVYLIYVLLNLPELKGSALVYGKLYLISTSLAVLAIRLSAMTRVQMYFDIFSIIALPMIFKHNLEKGKVVIDKNNIPKTIIEILKRYVLPALIVIIYFLRYYSFFTNDLWESFREYRTILGANVEW